MGSYALFSRPDLDVGAAVGGTGGGKMSSSDGQRCPVRGKSRTARAMNRYFVDEGVGSYTHVSEQHSTHGTKVIPATDREAAYVLDEILGNATDLRITEHATGTAGQTLTVSSLSALTGFTLSPRIRDLAASLEYGHSTASLVVGKLHASSRRSALARALVEHVDPCGSYEFPVGQEYAPIDYRPPRQPVGDPPLQSQVRSSSFDQRSAAS